MSLDATSSTLPLIIAVVACLYASVGHGGASGYLAVLSLTTLASQSVAASALVLNLVVATIAFLAFRQADRFSGRLTWPFLLGAAPMAFLGASVKLSERVYFVLVGVVVLWAGIRLLIARVDSTEVDRDRPPATIVGIAVGAAVGLLSGLVGVGGGIFLSPILVLAGWADAKRTSATSAIFIVSNSAIGLLARARTGIELPPNFIWLATGGALGALLGSWIGAKRLPVPWLRRLLGAVLLVAAVKLILKQ
jgi:uncharacterized membrane protein YfcA